MVSLRLLEAVAYVLLTTSTVRFKAQSCWSTLGSVCFQRVKRWAFFWEILKTLTSNLRWEYNVSKLLAEKLQVQSFHRDLRKSHRQSVSVRWNLIQFQPARIIMLIVETRTGENGKTNKSLSDFGAFSADEQLSKQKGCENALVF